MPKVTVARRGPSLFVVHVDGERLAFEDDVATFQVRAGEHALQWFVRGLEGTDYRLEITAPKEAAFALRDRLDRSMQDAGLKWFRVDE